MRSPARSRRSTGRCSCSACRATELLRAGESRRGLPVAAEGFADRCVRAGRIADAAQSARRGHPRSSESWSRARCGWRAKAWSPRATAREIPMRVATICTHGDTPGSHDLARRLRDGLERAGVSVRARWRGVTGAGAPRVVGHRIGAGAAGADRRGARLDARRVRRHALRDGAAGVACGARPVDDRRRRAGLGHARRRRGRRARLRLDRRSVRPHARADGEHPALLGVHRRVRPGAGLLAAASRSGCSSASAWAASGRAAPRSCRESWPAEHRGKALGFMQSGWAIGYAAAAARQLRRPAGVRLAGRVLRRHPAGVPDDLDPAPTSRSRRSGSRAGSQRRRSRRIRQLFTRNAGAADHRAHVHECLHAVRVVGFLPLASELSASRSRKAASGCRCFRARDSSW